MDEYYRTLGLYPGAGEDEVLEAYRRLARENDPENYTDRQDKRDARRNMQRINKAFDRIMNYMRRGTVEVEDYGEEGREFYSYIRKLIQQGQYDTAINQLTAYNNEDEPRWQFLMGSALYYGGYVSKSFEHFERAAKMAPDNPEYASVFSRMEQSKKGNIQNSPRNSGYDISGAGCGDPCTLCQCLVCLSCFRR